MFSSGNIFEQRILRFYREIREFAFGIIVFGSGPSDGANFGKRVEIRDQLLSAFPNSEVRLPEELDLRRLTEAFFPTLLDEELAQVLNADLVFALDTGQGVGEEIAHFSVYPRIARKLVVLRHERFRGSPSFASAVRQSLCVQWYTDEDFASCNLAKQICLRGCQTTDFERRWISA